MMDGEKKVIFEGNGIRIIINGSYHDCSVCVHRHGCKKSMKSLIKNWVNWEHGTVIYIPNNCPIAIERMEEKVIFT